MTADGILHVPCSSIGMDLMNDYCRFNGSESYADGAGTASGRSVFCIQSELSILGVVEIEILFDLQERGKEPISTPTIASFPSRRKQIHAARQA